MEILVYRHLSIRFQISISTNHSQYQWIETLAVVVQTAWLLHLLLICSR